MKIIIYDEMIDYFIIVFTFSFFFFFEMSFYRSYRKRYSPYRSWRRNYVYRRRFDYGHRSARRYRRHAPMYSYEYDKNGVGIVRNRTNGQAVYYITPQQ